MIINKIKNGTYNKHAPTYNIVIDGEFMRHKGMVKYLDSNLTREVSMARKAFAYVCNLICKIQNHLEKAPARIVIYMDGKRIPNKEVRVSATNYNRQLLRQTFIDCCENAFYEVVQLQEGESELVMYLERDKTVGLNVFVTNDSDMIPICYDHKPTLNDTSTTPPLKLLRPIISDDNSTYVNAGDVIDSCMWLRCGNKELIAIGMDFSSHTMKFMSYPFKVLVSLCGTDFTSSLVTNTMVKGIIDATQEDITLINSFTDFHLIVSHLIKIGVQNGGRLKSIKHAKETCDLQDFKKIFDRYYKYITTGVMMQDQVISPPSMADVCNAYLSFL